MGCGASVEGPQRAAPVPPRIIQTVSEGLKDLYFSKVKHLEEEFKYPAFVSPFLSTGDFEAKPMILLLGQYSTGKTTFIKYLLQREYPGSHIGPEPTTDRFVVVMEGNEDKIIPGQTLAVQTDKPYMGLSVFGTGFLSRFEGSQCTAPVLGNYTLVDTPGVLAGEKQRIERTYNFVEVCSWFANKCDLILLLFDPYKLDISDEFKAVITTLKGNDDKVRVVLNKADQLDQQELMRIYGALMWNLSRVLTAPEVTKVYIGSFNADAPINTAHNPADVPLFEKEQNDLLSDLTGLPKRSTDRKVNEFVKRMRSLKIQMLLLGHLRSKLPLFGRERAQKDMIDELEDHYRQVSREHQLPLADFPPIAKYRETLGAFDFTTFPKASDANLKAIDEILTVDIPYLVRRFSASVQQHNGSAVMQDEEILYSPQKYV